jgi:hypothetical protein
VRTAASISSTESEIAAVAYQLWLENGCSVGSGREDWFRAEAMLKNAFEWNSRCLRHAVTGPPLRIALP